MLREEARVIAQQFLNEAIEVIERYTADGMLEAETEGGQQVVKIKELPSKQATDLYNPSMGADARAGKPRSKTYTIPRRFQISYSQNGSKQTAIETDYDIAIGKAIYHSKHGP